MMMSREFLLLLAALACVVASAVDPTAPTCTPPGWCGGGQTDKEKCEQEQNFVDLTDESSAASLKDAEPLALEGGTTTTSITYTSLKTSEYVGRVVTNADNPAKRAFGDVTVTCTSTCNGGGTVNGCDADWSGCSSCTCFGTTTGSCTCTKISKYTESKKIVAEVIDEDEDDGSHSGLRI